MWQRIGFFVAITLSLSIWVVGIFVAIHRHKEMTPTCELVDEVSNQTGCHQKPDGTFACFLGDVPPVSWGQCLEANDGTFTCLKGNELSHYKGSEPDPLWTMSAEKCTAVANQILRDYKAPSLQIQVPVIDSPKEKI